MTGDWGVLTPRAWIRTGAAPCCTWFSVRSTDGPIGFRKMLGKTPISTATTIIGTMTSHSRGRRSTRRAFFSFVTVP